jgi:hypothetical protein
MEITANYFNSHTKPIKEFCEENLKVGAAFSCLCSLRIKHNYLPNVLTKMVDCMRQRKVKIHHKTVHEGPEGGTRWGG